MAIQRRAEAPARVQQSAALVVGGGVMDLIHISLGKDVTIREMAETMKEVVGYKGKLTFDTIKPDGAPRKLIDVTRLSNMGWRYSVDLKDGLTNTYSWFLAQSNE